MVFPKRKGRASWGHPRAMSCENTRVLDVKLIFPVLIFRKFCAWGRIRTSVARQGAWFTATCIWPLCHPRKNLRYVHLAFASWRTATPFFKKYNSFFFVIQISKPNSGSWALLRRQKCYYFLRWWDISIPICRVERFLSLDILLRAAMYGFVPNCNFPRLFSTICLSSSVVFLRLISGLRRDFLFTRFISGDFGHNILAGMQLAISSIVALLIHATACFRRNSAAVRI